MPKKVGRPTKYNKKFCITAFNFLKKGFSKEALAGKIGISKKTLYSWEDSFPEFLNAIKRGEVASQLFWEKMGIQGARGEIKNFNSVAWLFNMKNRFSWKDKIDHTTNDEPITGVAIMAPSNQPSLPEGK
jgi:hypothetical protein